MATKIILPEFSQLKEFDPPPCLNYAEFWSSRWSNLRLAHFSFPLPKNATAEEGFLSNIHSRFLPKQICVGNPVKLEDGKLTQLLLLPPPESVLLLRVAPERKEPVTATRLVLLPKKRFFFSSFFSKHAKEKCIAFSNVFVVHVFGTNFHLLDIQNRSRVRNAQLWSSNIICWILILVISDVDDSCILWLLRKQHWWTRIAS